MRGDNKWCSEVEDRLDLYERAINNMYEMIKKLEAQLDIDKPKEKPKSNNERDFIGV